MKTWMSGLVMSLGLLASGVTANETLIVDGEEYALSTLMAHCQSITNDPAAQVTCFGSISKLMEQQASQAQVTDETVIEKREAFVAMAQFQSDDTGLLISGEGCNVGVTYYNNYFHISRRNISSIDLFSAQFDISNVQFDQLTEVRGAQVPLFTGKMAPGATAAMLGGVQLDSAQANFAPRSPAMTLGEYAVEIVNQLVPTEGQTFDFVLVHPQRSDAGAEIFNAFEAFASACRQAPPAWSASTQGNG